MEIRIDKDGYCRIKFNKKIELEGHKSIYKPSDFMDWIGRRWFEKIDIIEESSRNYFIFIKLEEVGETKKYITRLFEFFEFDFVGAKVKHGE